MLPMISFRPRGKFTILHLHRNYHLLSRQQEVAYYSPTIKRLLWFVRTYQCDSSSSVDRRIPNIRSMSLTATPSSSNNVNINNKNITTDPLSLLAEAQTKPSNDASDDEPIVRLNQILLQAIIHKDVEAYSKLCADDLTCIEPESQGQVIQGLDFHLYFMRQRPSTAAAVTNSLAQPSSPQDMHVLMTNVHVQRLGDNVAVISYVRIQQQLENGDSDGEPIVIRSSETRVWQKQNDSLWRCVHFHRS